MFHLRGFYISWILSALVMYGAFYFWHGIVLTDFYRISFSKNLLYLFSACSYLIISLLIFYVYHLKFMQKFFPNLWIRALMNGVVVGSGLFMMTTVLGISFNNQLSTLTVLLDWVWQIMEQSIGTFCIAILEFFILHPESENN